MRLCLNPENKSYLQAYNQEMLESNEYLAESDYIRGIDALSSRRILGNCEFLSLIGEKYLFTDLSKALEIFKSCLEVDPLHSCSLKGYASVKIQQKDYSQAESTLNKIPPDSQDATYHYLRGECYYFQDKKFHAKESFEKAHFLDPNH